MMGADHEKSNSDTEETLYIRSSEPQRQSRYKISRPIVEQRSEQQITKVRSDTGTRSIAKVEVI